MKTSKLLAQGLLKMLSGMVIVALVLFLPAGSWNYFNGWLFCGLQFLPMLVLGALLLWKAPALLVKRLNPKAAGPDSRSGWTHLPIWLVCLAAVLQLAAYGLYAEVMRENAWLSRTVEVQENQKVIDTGLYGIIRHPMYTATILLFLAMPLVLGSWVSFAIMLLYPVVIVFRIRNEEQVLEAGLAGYREYKQRVRCRLLPFIW